MDQIDEDTVKEMLKQKYITIYPSKADLKANKNWCNTVKNMFKLL